jgi:hypothetical protein
VLSGCSPVLVDQAFYGVPALDSGGGIDGVAGLVLRRSLLPCLLGPVAVVMSRVLGQNAPEVPLTVDQQVIETLAAQRTRPCTSRASPPIRPGPGPPRGPATF